MSLYLLINLASVAVPLIFTFHPRLRVWREWGPLWAGLATSAVFFLAWDVLYTHWGVWGFNPHYLQGVYLVNLPLEEVLFFICIPYACLFSYVCLNLLLDLEWTQKWGRPVAWLFVVTFAVIASIFADRLYTSVTLSLCAAFLLLHLLWWKTDWLGRFFYSWGVMLLPFFLVNGILTGSFIEGEVVWYNNAENLGIRMGTIPVEDFAYGMLMLLIAITVFEALKRRRPQFTHAIA